MTPVEKSILSVERKPLHHPSPVPNEMSIPDDISVMLTSERFPQGSITTLLFEPNVLASLNIRSILVTLDTSHV